MSARIVEVDAFAERVGLVAKSTALNALRNPHYTHDQTAALIRAAVEKAVRDGLGEETTQ